jgi:BirA family biotin operon repressor/biotin-[acetyl-CoA-carboxylase] ligase
VSTRHFVEAIPSTQTLLLELARSGAPIGTSVVARRQTAGVGRLDHVWVSPPGGLYLSLLAARPRRRSGLLPLALGERLREHFSDAYRIRAVLKWPNDVLVADDATPPRKLAGVVVESVDVGPSPAVAIGIGVNVAPDRRDFPSALRDRVAILRELTDHPPTPDQVEDEVRSIVDQTLELLETDRGGDALLLACRRGLFGRGWRAAIDGRRVGILRDLGEDGELIIEGESGRVSVWAGDLTLEGPA